MKVVDYFVPIVTDTAFCDSAYFNTNFKITPPILAAARDIRGVVTLQLEDGYCLHIWWGRLFTSEEMVPKIKKVLLATYFSKLGPCGACGAPLRTSNACEYCGTIKEEAGS